MTTFTFQLPIPTANLSLFPICSEPAAQLPDLDFHDFKNYSIPEDSGLASQRSSPFSYSGDLSSLEASEGAEHDYSQAESATGDDSADGIYESAVEEV